MADLKDKVAVVTGASSGIGAAIVKALLETGMQVVGLARRKEKIEELGKGFEGRLFAIKTDVSIEQDILDAVAWTEANVGPIYVLVNNAGLGYIKSLAEAESEQWRKLLDTNLLGVTLLTKEVIKVMKATNTEGFIINISSTAGHYPIRIPGFAVYQASKYGVTAFSESIRWELATEKSNIRITNLSPGLVESEMTVDLAEKLPFKWIKAEDIANGVKYILAQPANVNIAELTIRPVGESI